MAQKTERQGRGKRPGSSAGPIRRRNCFFCREKIDEIDYKNVNQLRRYISEKGKIRSRRSSSATRAGVARSASLRGSRKLRA